MGRGLEKQEGSSKIAENRQVKHSESSAWLALKLIEESKSAKGKEGKPETYQLLSSSVVILDRSGISPFWKHAAAKE